MTRREYMEAKDRLEEAKAELFSATCPRHREELREEIDHWSRILFQSGYQESEP